MLSLTSETRRCSTAIADGVILRSTLAVWHNCASEHGVTPFPWSDLLSIAGLILLNGLFAMSELAIVSARTAKLRAAEEKGASGARVAIELASNPGKFLSTVQIGITLVGIIAGAYSGASLGGPVGERLEALGVPAKWADEAGFALVIALTTYFSLVVGELVPKQVALRSAEPIAIVMARPMAMLAVKMREFFMFLSSYWRAVGRLSPFRARA